MTNYGDTFGKSVYDAPLKGRSSQDYRTLLRSHGRLSDQIGGINREQATLAGPAYGQGMKYYRDLLTGGAPQRAAMAPELRQNREGVQGLNAAVRNTGRSSNQSQQMAENARAGYAANAQTMSQAPYMAAQGLMAGADAGLNRTYAGFGMQGDIMGQAGRMVDAERDREQKENESRRAMWAQIGSGIARIALAPVLGA